MLIEIGLLLISLGIILLGAEVFTNGIEWLGKKLNLAEGAVGSILAAVGTALPETMIPVIAILFGAEEAGEEIGIGAILGAPFMLSTLAFFISGLAVIIYRKRRPDFPRMHIDTSVMGRDLGFFLVVYSVAIAAAFLQAHVWKTVVSVGLVAAYAYYVYLTLQEEEKLGEDHHLNPLFLARKNLSPGIGIILTQVAAALGLIVMGAHIFVDSVDTIAAAVGVPRFILALIIAPVATELPEKFNSIIWLSKGKDTLALGNITGAMVFQSSLIPALGIALTNWVLTTGAFLSAALAIGSAAAVWYQIVTKKHLTPYILMIGGGFYIVFVVLVVSGVIH
ncbi:membrane protein [Clostridiales bacterium PH28_bin88]|nr:membrane protein [Clostridiales bacterium PH28_bin88]